MSTIRYEIYVDSLFFINFIMNLYLYILVGKTLRRTATRIRVFLGSAVSAGLSVLLLLITWLPPFIKRFGAPMLISMAGAAVIFRIKSPRMIGRAAECLFIYAFAFGGFMKFLFSTVPLLKGNQEKLWYILGIGMLGYQATAWWIEKAVKNSRKNICIVRLCGPENEIEVSALIDTGNSLREPVSGKPVSIAEEALLDRLTGVKMPEKMKVIPFHSVGKNHGIMEGYEIPEIIINDENEKIRWQKAVVGISKNKVSAGGRYQMILHPDLCRETFEKM